MSASNTSQDLFNSGAVDEDVNTEVSSPPSLPDDIVARELALVIASLEDETYDFDSGSDNDENDIPGSCSGEGEIERVVPICSAKGPRKRSARKSNLYISSSSEDDVLTEGRDLNNPNLMLELDASYSEDQAIFEKLKKEEHVIFDEYETQIKALKNQEKILRKQQKDALKAKRLEIEPVEKRLKSTQSLTLRSTDRIVNKALVGSNICSDEVKKVVKRVTKEICAPYIGEDSPKSEEDFVIRNLKPFFDTVKDQYNWVYEEDTHFFGRDHLELFYEKYSLVLQDWQSGNSHERKKFQFKQRYSQSTLKRSGKLRAKIDAHFRKMAIKP